VLLIGLIYSENIVSGLKVLESNLSFLAIPVIFTRITDINERQREAIFNSFIIGLCMACLICLINAGIRYNATNSIQVFFFYNLTDVIGYQPTYFAYYLIFAITYLLYRFYFQPSERNYVLKSFGILFLFLMLLLTGGQTAFCGLLLVFSFFILKFLTEAKSKERKIGAALVVLMLLGMFLSMLVGIGERGLSLNDAWDRLVLWDSTIDAIPNLFFGVGTGDYKAVLNEYYLSHNLEKYATESYNSHNQFIQLLFSNGLLGVLSLMLIIGRPLYLSVKNHNFLGILLIFPFLVYGITEVFLGRYQGIVFFALVHQLCILQVSTASFTKFVKTV
jgi:O-antigen ligase